MTPLTHAELFRQHQYLSGYDDCAQFRYPRQPECPWYMKGYAAAAAEFDNLAYELSDV